ncbi:MAG TPA: aminoacyl-tRNA hydrolase [Sandaracinaceae bacterium]
MHLVVGLGNPGPRYAGHRHNVGFRVVERLAGEAEFRPAWKGRAARVRLAGDEVVLLEPLTYMNRSGESVELAIRELEVPLADVLVVHDELDLPFGTIRLKRGGGAAGHNGLKSIIARCGADFARLRIGIGRPPEGTVEEWVLGDFDEGESARLEDVLNDAARAVEAVVGVGLTAAMNTVNARRRD